MAMMGSMSSAEFEAHKTAQLTTRIAEEKWSRAQKICARIIRHPISEFGIVALVMISFVLMIIEADTAPEVPEWLDTLNVLLIAIYVIEIAMRVFVFRLAFFKSFVNDFDLLIIVVDVMGMVLDAVFGDMLPSLAALRISRILRLARGFKLVVRFPQLTLIVRGLISGISAAFYGVGLLLMILTVWSVCAVQFIQPVNERVSANGVYHNCNRCPGAFSDVRSSMLTFIQQIIAGDSWGQVTIPIIEESPATAIFFGLVFISIHVTIMNVILAVIVDTALKASQDERQAEAYNRAQAHLMNICKIMDADGSGDLTEAEIIGGFDDNEDFRDVLLSMEFKKEDMHMIFGILDSDMSGTVNYEEFISELFKMKKHDNHTLLVFIKHYITEIRRDVHTQVNKLLKERSHAAPEDAHGHLLPTATTLTASASHKEISCGSGAPGSERGTFFVEEKEQQQQECLRLTREPAPKKDGSWGEAASLQELGEELRHLRKVISDELLLSMKELTQNATQNSFSAAVNADQIKRCSQVGHVDSGRSPRPSLEPEGRKRPSRNGAAGANPPLSAWGLRTCCAVHVREAIVQDPKKSTRVWGAEEAPPPCPQCPHCKHPRAKPPLSTDS